MIGAALALMCAAPAAAQVAYSFNFDANSTGWTGTYSRYTGTTACGGVGGAMRRNIYSGTTNGSLISPTTGNSLGGSMTITYDYKVAVWSANTVGAATPWGSFDVQYGASAAGPWTTFATVSDEAQTGLCINKSHSFTPPAGPLFIRWISTWTGGDNYWNFDNVTVTELLTPCSGTPAPGDTTGSSIVCAGENLVLGLQNSTTGSGVTYQWYSSAVSSTGPWTPVGSGLATLTTSQLVQTWYYCDVTCSAGPSTGSSNVKQVDIGTVFPQGFGTGVINPNCWTTSALVGASLPDYNAASAFASGTGSARWNFYSISSGNEPVLTSPSFAPTAAGTQVYFDAAGATYTGGEIDTIELEETSDGVLWNPVATMTNEPIVGVLSTIGGTGTTTSNFLPTASQWASLAYPLTTGTVQIRFRGISDFGNSVFLDNISVGVLPSARHTKYGASCGSPAMTLNSATPPLAGSTMIYDLGDIPLACPSPDPVFHFGIVAVSLGQDFPGTDLLAGYGIDAPGCKLHITSLDVVIGYVDSVPTQQVMFDIPGFSMPGFTFYSQAAALICPNPPNNAGVILSNGLRSYVNSF